ncbi:RadC family protein [Vagococcus acidifermentans]|uniref:MPN domain-containing protein n=1 Tax=Vagococcus acidifermentans TaxID=564710 RepID=A0A430AQ41_9ENTE|nr:DNA repair protein RadC [Vagococcus acidifermentans]RSU10242.1 hypothetical protein CBF27_10880 [Vagococcus acidifermentans]
MGKLSNFMSSVPEEVRPRERLEKYGAEALSHQELLAIILRTGSREMDVMTQSLYILNHFNSLYELKKASLEELRTINGVGAVKSIEIKAMIELGKRIANSNQLKLGKITSSHELGRQLIEEMKDYHQEHLVVLYLNTKNELIKKEILFIGSVNQSIAHPREIFRGAVRYSAAQIILAHNHPTGSCAPSKQDEAFTRRVKECGELMGIELLDHLVIGNDSYVSFRETNRL